MLRGWWSEIVRLYQRWRQAKPNRAPPESPRMLSASAATPATQVSAVMRPIPPPLAAAPSRPPLVSPAVVKVKPTYELNRHDRRVFERARRRHDKFVKPAPVPTIVKVKDEDARPKPPPKPRANVIAVEELPEDDPNDNLIVDEWVEGDNEQVLYEESEFFGEFNFRDTILDQLDRYWFYLDRMRRHDPDAYGFYRQVGATLVPYMATDTTTDKARGIRKVKDIEKYKSEIVLPPWFVRHWPAFGCFAYGANPRDEASENAKPDSGELRAMKPKFLYYRSLIRMPWEVQPVRGGKCYMLTIWWDSPGMRKRAHKWGIPHDIPIHISDDGKRIRALKTRRQVGKFGPWWDWRLPGEYHQWSQDHGLDAQTHLTHMFCEVVRDVEVAAISSMLRVEVTNKDGLTAVFGVSPRRTSYFFQDRNVVLSEAGIKKRIFHSVRPHVRSDGTPVPMHFRGLREFEWAGYHVLITVPGRDHFHPLEFDVPGLRDPEPGKKLKDYVTEPAVGQRLRRQMHAGLGRSPVVPR